MCAACRLLHHVSGLGYVVGTVLEGLGHVVGTVLEGGRS
jgi:hypothetical protein